ncbi:MAG TPA: hypothetical protein VG963_06495, partial [Polyangiaceae bacterium]|nr:hypothetical protein [Polyangiaceae bacterium]
MFSSPRSFSAARRAFGLVCCALCAAFAWAWIATAPAAARKQRELPYRFEQTWNAAVRLVRVDLRMPVTDRDQEGGFLLFEYVSNEKRYPGSLELVAQTQSPRPATIAIVHVQGMPSYVEQMILDR